MTARQLEEFIHVIETAERIGSKSNDIYSSYRSDSDVFGLGSSKTSSRRVSGAVDGEPYVPKLWDPTSGSEFLGSSWSTNSIRSHGSSTLRNVVPGSHASKKAFSSPVHYANTTTRTASTQASPPSVIKSSHPSEHSSKVEYAAQRDVLMNIQRHNRFGKVHSSELSPATTPNQSPVTTRRNAKKTPPSTSPKSPLVRSPPKFQSPKLSPKKPTKAVIESNGSTDSNSSKSSSKSIPPLEPDSPEPGTPAPKELPKLRTPKLSRKSSVQARNTQSKGSSRSSTLTPKKSPPIRTTDRSSDRSTKIESRSESRRTYSSSFESSRSLSESPIQSVINTCEEEDESRNGTPEPPRDTPPKPVPRMGLTRQTTVRESRSEVRPKSAMTKGGKTVPRIRPRSAPPKKKTDPPSPKVPLGRYSKSLKLLGIEVPSVRTEATKLSHHETKVMTDEPTIRTRLTKRTQSVSDLREVIGDKKEMRKSEFKEVKQTLSKAVFEEWYFKKSEEEERLKIKKKEEEEYQKKLKDEEENEKKERALEEYNKWLEKKKQREKASKVEKKDDEEKEKEEQERKKARREKAEAEWKEKKEREEKAKQKKKEKEAKLKKKEMEEKLQKKEDAMKQYEAWKQKIDQKRAEEFEEKRKKRLAELEAKREEAREQKEDAEKAFKAWKNQKDELRSTSKGGKRSKLDINHNERIEAAQDAYENWLTYIEQREEEEKLAQEEKLLREMWRPPWYPGGVSPY